MTDAAQTPVEETTNTLPPVMQLQKLTDPYEQRIYDGVVNDIRTLMKSITFGDATLAGFLGESQEQVIALILNEAIQPLITALGNHHSTVQAMDRTVLPVLQRDLVLHRMPDIYMLNQYLGSLRRNCQVYWTAAQLFEKYPAEDGWSANLIEVEGLVAELHAQTGTSDVEGEVPFRNVPISVVTTDGTLYERARYCNFTYTDTADRTQNMSDAPAIWLEDKQEFMTLGALGLWRYAPEHAIVDMIDNDIVTQDELVKAYGNTNTAGDDKLLRGMFDAKEELVKSVKE